MLWLVVPWVVLLFPADGRAADTIENRLERIEAKMLTREEFKLFVELQDRRFEAVNQRIDDINRRFEFIQSLLVALLTVVVGSTIYNVWDRRRESDLKQRIERIEAELHHVSASRAPGR